jgi:hypothetical protein
MDRCRLRCDDLAVTPKIIHWLRLRGDRICDLVFRHPGYRPEVPGSIPGATRFNRR